MFKRSKKFPLVKPVLLLAALTLLLVLAACQSLYPPLAAPAPTGVEVAEVAEPESTEAPMATATEAPTATPEPTNTPTPEPTDTPTPAPTATPIPAPTDTPAPAAAAAAAPVKSLFVMTEAEANKQVQNAIAAQPNVPISEVYVDLRPDRIAFGGRAKIGFFAMDLEIEASLPVSDCRPQPKIEQVKVNDEAAAGFIRTQVENQVAPYLSDFTQMDLGICVEEIEITDNEIIITGFAP